MLYEFTIHRQNGYRGTQMSGVRCQEKDDDPELFTPSNFQAGCRKSLPLKHGNVLYL